MSFPYKHVVLIGATSGIGLAMATRLIKEGVKVTAVGRRKERLEQFVKDNGSKASFIQHDISKIENAQSFASDAFKQFPEIDSVFINAGVQGLHPLAAPGNFDLDSFLHEFFINFNCVVALAHAFLPLLKQRDIPTSLVFTTTHLAIIPGVGISAYSASKHALNAFILCLRSELAAEGQTGVRIVELLPPVVQTELHDYMGEERGRSLGMPLDVFTEQAFKGLAGGDDTVSIGTLGVPGTESARKITEILHDIQPKRQVAFDILANELVAVRKSHS